MAGKYRPSESRNLADFRRYLRLHGCLVWRRNVGKFRMQYRGRWRTVACGEPGQSDLWGFLPDERASHFECEVKRPGGRPTPQQVAWLQLINTKTNGYAFWADSLDMLQTIFAGIMAGRRIAIDEEGRQFWES